MTKQYIKSTNEAPKLYLLTPLLFCIAIKFYGLPMWLYGAVATLFLIANIGVIIRICTEEGIDVVRRDK